MTDGQRDDDSPGKVWRELSQVRQDQALLAQKVGHIDASMTTGLKQINDSLTTINTALVGTAQGPGIIAQQAADHEQVKTHSRYFRLIVFTFIAQIGGLVAWGAHQLWSVIVTGKIQP